MTDAAKSACKSCGAPLDWGVTAKGRKMPINRKPGEPGTNNLTVVGTFKDGILAVDVVQPGEGTRISHFATCPEAAKHRRRR